MSTVPRGVREVKTPTLPPPDDDRLDWEDDHWYRTERWLEHRQREESEREECDRRYPRLIRACGPMMD